MTSAEQLDEWPKWKSDLFGHVLQVHESKATLQLFFLHGFGALGWCFVARLDFETCIQEQVRLFPVPPIGSAYSPQTCHLAPKVK